MLGYYERSRMNLFPVGGQLVFINKEYEIFTFKQCSGGKDWEICLQFLDRNYKRYSYRILDSLEELLIGRRKWIQTENQKEVEIAVTVCNSTSYTCDDGQCIPLRQRCDIVRHCKDYSDEGGDCNILPYFPSTYWKTVCPMDKVNPSISLSVFNFGIYNVEMNKNSVEMLLRITLKWVDHRLYFKHLVLGEAYQVPLEELPRFWRPKIDIPQASFKDNLHLDNGTEMNSAFYLISSSNGSQKNYDSRESK